MRGHLTEKTDVFAFGVVALEIVSGRLNFDSNVEEEKAYLLEWVWLNSLVPFKVSYWKVDCTLYETLCNHDHLNSQNAYCVPFHRNEIGCSFYNKVFWELFLFFFVALRQITCCILFFEHSKLFKANLFFHLTLTFKCMDVFKLTFKFFFCSIEEYMFSSHHSIWKTIYGAQAYVPLGSAGIYK